MPYDPGVYQFLTKDNEVLYVGKAKNLRKRVASYFSSSLGPKTQIMVSQAYKIRATIVQSEFESLLLEANLIKKFKPKYNSRLTDGKVYLLIRITLKEKYPKVFLARREEDPASVYFGPYPNSTAVKTVLKTIRRIFPFESSSHKDKRICLYNHLGLCPCAEVFNSENVRKNYKKNISNIIKFLDGKKDQVIKNLQNDRNNASKTENYEHASTLQKQIDAMVYVTSKFRKPFEYELNPNLREDIHSKQLVDLKQILVASGVAVKSLTRIECYDISNLAGKQAVGSMVVFVNGEKNSFSYRRFKIIAKTPSQNDFLMMEEIITRRLKHTEWEPPGLIIVDGGKGQISSAKKAMASHNVNIPLIGLAKKEETIITHDFKEIHLPKDSQSLHLVMRIRDEAHRFAITYQKKLRSKIFISL